MPHLHHLHRPLLLSLCASLWACSPKQSAPEPAADLEDVPAAVSEALPALPPEPVPAAAPLATPPAPETPRAKPKPRRPKTPPAAPALAKDSVPLPIWDGRPILHSELAPLLSRLYREADSLAGTAPDSALVRINFALRYSDDGAFYALAARIAQAHKDPYQAFVLAERGYLKGSRLAEGAAEENLRLQVQAMRSIRSAAPSEESEAQYYQLANLYHRRFQRIAPEAP